MDDLVNCYYMIKSKKLSLFIVFLFFISSCFVIIFHAFGGRMNTYPSTLFLLVYMFIPLLSTFIVQKIIYKQEIKKTVNISFRVSLWWILPCIIPIFTTFSIIILSTMLPGVTFSPDMTGFFERMSGVLSETEILKMKYQFETAPMHPFWITLLSGILFGATLNAIAAFGEESGWRGFLLRELSSYSFIKASIIIGIIWGLWHAPIILLGYNYPEHRIFGVFMMILNCVLLSPIFSYISVKTKSVIPVSILHGCFNGTAILPLMMLKGGDSFLVGYTGLTGTISYLLIDICIYLGDRRLFAKSVCRSI